MSNLFHVSSKMSEYVQRLLYDGTPISALPCGIFVSGYEASKDISLLKRLKIDSIVQIMDYLVPLHADIEYKVISIKDAPDEDLYSHFDSICDWIMERRQQDRYVLIHYQMGRSRSVTMCLAFLMRYGRFPLRKAKSIVKQCIGHMSFNPNDGFLEQLQRYEKDLTDRGIQPIMEF
jgi:atypical dual specificity phosphatase